MKPAWRLWSDAWQRAAYGPDGFYLRHVPSEHFSTSVLESAGVARAVVEVLLEVDDRLGQPPALTVVDVGAGDGQLSNSIARLCSGDPGLVGRVSVIGVDLRDRPESLDPAIDWITGAAPSLLPRDTVGVLVAHEWLDDIPLDVVLMDDAGEPRLLLVDDSNGAEEFGPSLMDDLACLALGIDAAEYRNWIVRWWPRMRPGERIEIGASRDRAWTAAVDTVEAGAAIAIDYAHIRDERTDGRFAGGTLTGYRAGHHDLPVPDGASNLTAHVALDACASAASAALGQHLAATTLVHQREVVAARRGTTVRSVGEDAVDFLRRLAAREAEALVDDAAGDFWWLRQDVVRFDE